MPFCDFTACSTRRNSQVGIALITWKMRGQAFELFYVPHQQSIFRYLLSNEIPTNYTECQEWDRASWWCFHKSHMIGTTTLFNRNELVPIWYFLITQLLSSHKTVDIHEIGCYFLDTMNTSITLIFCVWSIVNIYCGDGGKVQEQF